MRPAILLAATIVVFGASGLALAAEKMGKMSMMRHGEVIAVIPDGHMGMMTVKEQKMMDSMVKMAKPLDHCVMMMSDNAGKVFMVDTSSPDAMKECEKVAK